MLKYGLKSERCLSAPTRTHMPSHSLIFNLFKSNFIKCLRCDPGGKDIIMNRKQSSEDSQTKKEMHTVLRGLVSRSLNPTQFPTPHPPLPSLISVLIHALQSFCDASATGGTHLCTLPYPLLIQQNLINFKDWQFNNERKYLLL